jgi:amidase
MDGAARRRDRGGMYNDTPRARLEQHLERIDRLDGALRAFRSVRREAALAEADAAAARAPLHGMAIAIKDNMDVAGEVTGHGTSLPLEPAREDCEAVRRLRAAGAIVIGRTAMPELALWGHDTTSRATGGTRNPHDATRSPGGSSGGSATAVAAGMAAAALGTDGGGSVRIPAACCGLVGLKPQRDRLPLAPDDGHWLGLSHLGPIARTVADAALLADVLGATGLRDAAQTDPGRLRIAVSVKPALPCRLHPEMRAAVERTVALLRALGHTVLEREVDYGDIRPLFVPRYARGAFEDSERLGGPRGLEPRARSIVRIGRRLGGPARRAVAGEAARAARINRIFEEADVVLTPATAEPAPRLGQGVHRSGVRSVLASTPWVAYTPPWNVTGQPAMSVPAGVDASGVPVGVQLVARPHDEATIVALAAQMERSAQE